LEEKIPRTKDGDPGFERLGAEDIVASGEQDPRSILGVFTEEQIVHLINSQLYSLLYQRETHRKRAAAERETLGPVKAKVKELFGVSYLKATDEQLAVALKEVRKEAANVQE